MTLRILSSMYTCIIYSGFLVVDGYRVTLLSLLVPGPLRYHQV